MSDLFPHADLSNSEVPGEREHLSGQLLSGQGVTGHRTHWRRPVLTIVPIRKTLSSSGTDNDGSSLPTVV